MKENLIQLFGNRRRDSKVVPGHFGRKETPIVNLEEHLGLADLLIRRVNELTEESVTDPEVTRYKEFLTKDQDSAARSLGLFMYQSVGREKEPERAMAPFLNIFGCTYPDAEDGIKRTALEYCLPQIEKMPLRSLVGMLNLVHEPMWVGDLAVNLGERVVNGYLTRMRTKAVGLKHDSDKPLVSRVAGINSRFVLAQIVFNPNLVDGNSFTEFITKCPDLAEKAMLGLGTLVNYRAEKMVEKNGGNYNELVEKLAMEYPYRVQVGIEKAVKEKGWIVIKK